MKNILTSIFLLSTIVFTSCEKSTVAEDTTGIKGTWNLVSITGGITGQGYTAKFDAIKINNNTFDLLKTKAVIYTGNYVLTPSIAQPDSFKITSAPTSADFIINVSTKKIDIIKNDKLVLSEPCCDLYTYEFSRVVN